MTLNSLPPDVAETQPGKCNLCGAEKPLTQLINHLIDEHGQDPSDLKIEGGKVSEATVTKAGEADCGHELAAGDTVIVLDPFDRERKTECMACYQGGDTTLGSSGR